MERATIQLALDIEVVELHACEPGDFVTDLQNIGQDAMRAVAEHVHACGKADASRALQLTSKMDWMVHKPAPADAVRETERQASATHTLHHVASVKGMFDRLSDTAPFNRWDRSSLRECIEAVYRELGLPT